VHTRTHTYTFTHMHTRMHTHTGLSSLTAIDGDFFPEEVLSWSSLHLTELVISSSFTLTVQGMVNLVPQMSSLVGQIGCTQPQFKKCTLVLYNYTTYAHMHTRAHTHTRTHTHTHTHTHTLTHTHTHTPHMYPHRWCWRRLTCYLTIACRTASHSCPI